MLWELLVRNNLGVFLEEVVERGVHSQREYASKEEGHGGSLDSILPCLLVPAKHLLRPLFVSLLGPETGNYDLLRFLAPDF